MKLLALLCVLGVCLGGCAIAQRDDGSFVLGFGMSGDGTTASGAGQAAAGILGALGVPGATAIGTGVTAVLGLLGAAKYRGDARANAARREGERHGWEEAAATYQPPPGGVAAGTAGGRDRGAAGVAHIPDPGTGIVT